MQLRGLDSTIIQATQAVNTVIYYAQELMTTFGLVHTLTQSPEQLDAELRGRASFLDPRAFFPLGLNHPLPRSPHAGTSVGRPELNN